MTARLGPSLPYPALLPAFRAVFSIVDNHLVEDYPPPPKRCKHCHMLIDECICDGHADEFFDDTADERDINK